MKNLEQTVETSFLNKVRVGLNRVKQSTFNKIAVYSLAGVLGAGLGYGCGGNAGPKGSNLSDSNGIEVSDTSVNYACDNNQCVGDSNDTDGIFILTLDSHNDTLNRHSDTLDSYNNKLDSHQDTLDSQSEVLDSYNNLDSHQDTLDSQSEVLDSYSENIETVDKKYKCNNNQCVEDPNGIYAVADCNNQCVQIVNKKYSCNKDQCVEDPNGIYAVADCNNQCVQIVDKKYSCDKDQCIEDPNGTYAVADCNNECVEVISKKYSCVDNKCVEFPNGIYAVADCNNECVEVISKKYSCVDGECVEFSEGIYAVADCNNQCVQIVDKKYSCDKDQCIEDPNGTYAVADCNNECVEVINKKCWEKTFGESYADEAASIQQTADLGFIVAGHKKKDGDYMSFISKLDEYGNVVWEEVENIAYLIIGDNAVNSIQQTKDLGYIAAGHDFSDALIIKLSSDGDWEWYKEFGGNWFDWANSIQQTTDEGYIVAGIKGGGDAWILKLDSEGELEWDKIIGDGGQPHSIRQTNDLGYIVAAKTDSKGAGKDDAWVFKLDQKGVLKWEKTFGESNDDEAKSVIQTSDGGYTVAGYTTLNIAEVDHKNALVLKLDSNGDQEWKKNFEGLFICNANSIQQTTDLGYIVAGGKDNMAWIAKLDSEGNMTWEKSFDQNSNQKYIHDFFSIQQTLDEGYIAAGEYGWVVRLDSNGDLCE